VPAAKSRPLALRHTTLDLPGPPAKIMSTDIDGDSRRDLAVVVAYTEVEEIGEDRIENMVQVTTVIPALFDRRELRIYLATASGDFVETGRPLPLPPSVLHMEPGPAGTGIVALTDRGLARLKFDPADGALSLEPLIDDPPVLAGTGSFYAALELVHDFDGDGVGDVFLPTDDGIAIYLGTGSGIARDAVTRIGLSADTPRPEGTSSRRYLLPEFHQVNGDGLPDLVFDNPFAPGKQILLGAGDGRFTDLRTEALDCHDRLTDLRFAVATPESYPWPRKLTALRDLDGDGRAEAVLQVERSRGDSFGKEMKDAKKPIHLYSFHELTEELSIDPEPYYEMEVLGHSMETDADDGIPFSAEQFEDLDGDGREDLVTITLNFSIFQATTAASVRSRTWTCPKN